MNPRAERIETLDLVRGVAVLGILAVNILTFAGPSLAGVTPEWPEPATPADRMTFAAMLLLFEGKMRALFTLLFGAGMALFIDRAEERGRDGALLQARRLGWLMLFGYLHYALVWQGDILFTYAVIGMAMLAFHRMDAMRLMFAGLAFFLLWHLVGAAATVGPFAPDPAKVQAGLQARAAQEAAVQAAGYSAMVRHRLGGEWHHPLDMALSSLGETAPLVAIGMALGRTGFFAGEWPRKTMRAIALWGTAAGFLLTLAFVVWALPRGFPAPAMLDYLLYWSALPHLLMALGYAALLVLAAPLMLSGALGGRLVAAGRTAFSNYIGTSLVMCLLFNGWGLGLALRFGELGLAGFVLLGWLLMLAWPRAWLARFRQGPLEWLWRSLTERRILPLKR